MIKPKALEQLSVADWTEVAGVCVSLSCVVESLHQALVPSAVSHTEHVPQLMGCYFDHSLKNH